MTLEDLINDIIALNSKGRKDDFVKGTEYGLRLALKLMKTWKDFDKKKCQLKTKKNKIDFK